MKRLLAHMRLSRPLKIVQKIFKRIRKRIRRLYKVGAFAIILDEQRQVLLCHRGDVDLWNLPGGQVERGETTRQAVIREVKEETGFDVAVNRLAGIYVNPVRNNIAFSFVCEILGGTMTTSDESDAIAYFPFDKIPKYTSPYHKASIQDVLHKSHHFHLKIHYGVSAKKLLRQGKL